MSELMPTLFFGHGNPMLTLSQNAYTKGWSEAGRSIPRPAAVLAISAHWFGGGISVSSSARPATIHDFYGFPEELFEIRYPAPGEPLLASRVRDLLGPQEVGLNRERGLDHGVWCILRHLFPEADIPVVQLSMDAAMAAKAHYQIGEKLAPLRREGVLILGSGNIVHNLAMYSWESRSPVVYDWALRFEKQARELLTKRRDSQLIDFESLGPDARLSIPTPEHYLPLLYVLGASEDGERPTFPIEGIDGGSMSMLAVRMG